MVEVPHRQKPYEKPTGERRGLLIVNTGDGKGKTTAAIGLAVRAHGRGKPLRFFQFMKVGVARFGEHRALEQLGIKLEGLEVPRVVEALKSRPGHVHVVITGRRCPAELIEIADTVTEMTMIKHAFKAGVPAQHGIEH